jgi:hypothetical protein
MKGEKKRRWKWIVLGTLALCLANAMFWLTGEDKHYIEAAKGLEAARLEAGSVFGTLSFEEYREEQGYKLGDDRAQWDALARSIPEDIDYLGSDGWDSPQADFSARVQEHRDWFLGAAEQATPLKFYFREFDDQIEGQLMPYQCTVDLIRALRIGINGAAYTGDKELIRTCAETGYLIAAKISMEVDLLSPIHQAQRQEQIERALLTAALQNRSDDELLNLVIELCETGASFASPIEVFEGYVRGQHSKIEQLRSLPHSAVPSWMFEHRQYRPEPENRIEESARRIVGRLNPTRDLRYFRKGKRYPAALEARYWETMVQVRKLLDVYSGETESGIQQLEDLVIAISSHDDPSYELAAEMFQHTTPFTLMSGDLLSKKASLAAAKLIQRFPNHENLPDELPADLIFLDPFGKGENVLFRKTETGFIIYGLYTNGIDDGFEVRSGAENQYIGRFPTSEDALDYGLVVNYVVVESDD